MNELFSFAEVKNYRTGVVGFSFSRESSSFHAGIIIFSGHPCPSLPLIPGGIYLPCKYREMIDGKFVETSYIHLYSDQFSDSYIAWIIAF